VIHTAPLDFILWFSEFSLELVGGYIAFHAFRKIWPFWAYLWFRASADVATALILFFSGEALYSRVHIYLRAGMYTLQLILVVFIVGKMVNDRQETVAQYAAALSLTAAIGLAIFFRRPFQFETVVNVEASACLMLGIMICLGLAGRTRPPERPWNAITAGMLILLAGRAAAALMERYYGFEYWGIVARIYPLTDIAALGTWAAFVWGGVAEFRMPLTVRVEALPKKRKPKPRVRLRLGVKIEGTAKGASE